MFLKNILDNRISRSFKSKSIVGRYNRTFIGGVLLVALLFDCLALITLHHSLHRELIEKGSAIVAGLTEVVGPELEISVAHF